MERLQALRLSQAASAVLLGSMLLPLAATLSRIAFFALLASTAPLLVVQLSPAASAVMP